MEQPRTNWQDHPHRAMLEEVAAAEAKLRAATERRRRLIIEIMSQPEADRPTISDLARALGLPRGSVHSLMKSAPVY